MECVYLLKLDHDKGVQVLIFGSFSSIGAGHYSTILVPRSTSSVHEIE